MKTLIIEGFTVETDLDEQDVFVNMNHDNLDLKTINAIEGELYAANIVDFIEKVGIGEMPVRDYFYENCRGYKKRSLEPFNWRASKKAITLIYTGAMGGEGWSAKIFLN